MSIPVKRMLRTRGALAAAVTALGFGAALILGQVLVILVGLIAVGESTGPVFSYEPSPPFAGLVDWALLSVLPISVGYFLGLWVIAPITEQLRIGHVITRAILATGAGSTVHFVVIAIVQSVDIVSLSPERSIDGIPLAVGAALIIALTGLIVLLPLGVLGGVLLWVRRTAKPSEHHIEGLIDV